MHTSRRRLGLIAAVVITTVMALMPAISSANDNLSVPDSAVAEIAANKQADQYIVVLADPPVVTSMTGRDGQRPTRADSSAQREAVRLQRQHDRILTSVGAGADQKLYDYVWSMNGFTATLTGAQAAALQRRGDVLMVQKDVLSKPTTETSPAFLGLTDPADGDAGGLWTQGYDGEDVIVGVIDTGVWPEHPSFSDQIDLADRPGAAGKRSEAYGAPPAGWGGTCQSGEQFSKDDCNNKVIGARYYLSGFGHFGVIKNDYKSPRDADGHGSHTASTAAGNTGVTASIFGVDRGTVSGMAPRARIAVYKVCWNGDAGGCATSDTVAAIDDAVADGVDVINFSIGSDVPTLLGADDVSFLFASLAGVFVATSNGNAGPGAGTVGAPASIPWVTSVGASTHTRTFEGDAVLGGSATVTGASLTAGTDQLPLVDAALATLADDPDRGALCYPGELDPEQVAGKIVFCTRGEIARVAKSLAVAQAGGAGMILANALPDDTLVTDNHYVPSVHISDVDGVIVQAYLDSAATPTAQLSGGAATEWPGQVMAAFSSRGPNGAAEDIIKPDITAPGVNILAANSPTAMLGAPGQYFQAISGTSMSSPHMAGLAALMTEARPDWSPAAMKSAFMTTALGGVFKEDGTTLADPFDAGAGHVNPNPALDPGLVYEADFYDYLDFLIGMGELPAGPWFGQTLNGIDASDLNLASIGIGKLAGNQTITRTVTATTAGTYEATVDGLADLDVVVDPDVLELDEGESATFEVTFTTLGTADIGEWTFGSLTWTSSEHAATSPIAVKPVHLAKPDEVHETGETGSDSFEIGFGYTGDLNTSVRGLVKADEIVGNVVDDPANDINVALESGTGITVHEVEIPAGTTHTRFSLFDDFTDGADDLDLYVFGPADDFPFAGGSGSATSEEQVDLVDPVQGTYLVVVHGWQTDGADANYTLFHYNVDSTDADNLTVVAPASALLGSTGTVDISWDVTGPGTYLGAIDYDSGGDPFAETLVRIDAFAASSAAATAGQSTGRGQGGRPTAAR